MKLFLRPGLTVEAQSWGWLCINGIDDDGHPICLIFERNADVNPLHTLRDALSEALANDPPVPAERVRGTGLAT